MESGFCLPFCVFLSSQPVDARSLLICCARVAPLAVACTRKMVDMYVVEVRHVWEVHLSTVVAEQGPVQRQGFARPNECKSCEMQAMQKNDILSMGESLHQKCHGNMETESSSALWSAWCRA